VLTSCLTPPLIQIVFTSRTSACVGFGIRVSTDQTYPPMASRQSRARKYLKVHLHSEDFEPPGWGIHGMRATPIVLPGSRFALRSMKSSTQARISERSHG